VSHVVFIEPPGSCVVVVWSGLCVVLKCGSQSVSCVSLVVWCMWHWRHRCFAYLVSVGVLVPLVASVHPLMIMCRCERWCQCGHNVVCSVVLVDVRLSLAGTILRDQALGMFQMKSPRIRSCARSRGLFLSLEPYFASRRSACFR
jgi:hypothetical protein